MSARTEALVERFWAKVDKDETRWPWTGCWTWTGRTNPKGYGVIFTPPEVISLREEQQAHRVSWFLTYGPFPVELCVLHRCDNPPCVRPDHLFLGTRAENNADMQAKGRVHRPTWRGSAVPNAKLTDAKAAEIRSLYAGGVSQVELARRYGLTPPTISAVVTRRTWRHVP